MNESTTHWCFQKHLEIWRFKLWQWLVGIHQDEMNLSWNARSEAVLTVSRYSSSYVWCMTINGTSMEYHAYTMRWVQVGDVSALEKTKPQGFYKSDLAWALVPHGKHEALPRLHVTYRHSLLVFITTRLLVTYYGSRCDSPVLTFYHNLNYQTSVSLFLVDSLSSR